MWVTGRGRSPATITRSSSTNSRPFFSKSERTPPPVARGSPTRAPGQVRTTLPALIHRPCARGGRRRHERGGHAVGVTPDDRPGDGELFAVEHRLHEPDGGRAALEPGRAERRDERMGQVGVDGHARHEPAAEPVLTRHGVVVDLVLRALCGVPRLDAVLGQRHGSVEISFRYSASVNAFIVVVRTLPPAESMRMNFAAVSSLGASMTVTMSWAPIVR